MSNLEILSPRPSKQRPFLNIPIARPGKDSISIGEATTRAALVSRSSSPGTIVPREVTQPAEPKSLAERLYNSRAACKLKIAAVAMHVNQDWRTRFFAQVDSLLDIDDWDEDDAPISEASFATLIRMILLINAKRRPGLGATGDGHVISTWTTGRSRLTIECLPADEVRWVIVHYLDGERETAAGQTALPRLLHVLKPYNPDQWFADEGAKAPV